MCSSDLGVFAAASLHHPPDADRAVNLLAAAVQEGVAVGLLTTDRGLDPIRRHPRFDGLLAAAGQAEKGNRERAAGATLLNRGVEE